MPSTGAVSPTVTVSQFSRSSPDRASGPLDRRGLRTHINSTRMPRQPKVRSRRASLLVGRLQLLLALAALLLLSGCPSVPPPPGTVDPAILDGIVAWFVAQLAWTMGPVDLQKRFFVRRRAQALGGTHAA